MCCYTDSYNILLLLWPVTLLYKHIFNKSYFDQWRRLFFLIFFLSMNRFFDLKYVMSWQNNISWNTQTWRSIFGFCRETKLQLTICKIFTTKCANLSIAWTRELGKIREHWNWEGWKMIFGTKHIFWLQLELQLCRIKDGVPWDFSHDGKLEWIL